MSAPSEITVPTEVKFWFDPICPWSWVTSRWLTDVAQQRRIDIAWHLRSLSILNAGNPDLPDKQRRRIDAGWGPIRVCAAVR